MESYALAFYDSEKDSDPKNITATWPELIELLSRPRRAYTPCTGKSCPNKHGLAWSPVEIHGARANQNVVAVTLAVFDLDHLSAAQVQDIVGKITGYRYIVHSTHTHTPPDDQHLRLVLPLSRPVAAADWRSVYQIATEMLDVYADGNCKDLSRLYFLPAVCGDVEFVFEDGVGQVLDVDALFAGQKTTPAAPALPAPPAPVADVAVLIETLKATRYGYSRSQDEYDKERYNLLDRVLKGEPLAAAGARDASINQVASIIACSLPANTPAEVAVELMRLAIVTMEVAPEGAEHWLAKATYSYTRSMQRRVERDQERDRQNEALRDRLKASFGKSDQADPSTAVDAQQLLADPDAWKSLLKRKPDGNALKNVGANAALLLAYDEEFRGYLHFNEVTKDVEVSGGIFANVSSMTLDVTVTDYLEQVHDLTLNVMEVGQRLLKTAVENSYDPLKDYLLGCQWDQTPRISDFLINYCGALQVDGNNGSLVDYLRAISRKWFISAVARALSPGSKVDTVLVLEGKQGIRKSSAFAVLGGTWFCDSQMVLGNKDTQLLSGCSWIIELAELASLRKSDVEAQRAFLTSRIDKLRPPYGRKIEEFPRRCVFVGTTNSEQYLHDTTGNRRFWPVYCEAIDLNAIKRDRDQLWAEAVYAYRAGELWYFDTAADQHFAEQQADARVEVSSALSMRVMEWWYSLHPDRRPEMIKTHEIIENVLKISPDRINRALEMDIGQALRSIGFEHVRRRVYGVPAWVYVPTEQLKQAKQQRPNKPVLFSVPPDPAGKTP